MPPASLPSYAAFAIHTARNLRPSDIPLALAVHEGIGLGFLLSLWGVCYHVRPVSSLLSSTRWREVPGRLEQRATQSRLLAFVQNGIHWLPSAMQPSPFKLGVSLAESALLRRGLSPLTVPLKLWLTFKFFDSRNTKGD